MYLCIGGAFYALFIYLSHLIRNIHKCRWKGKIPIKHNETNDESKPRTPLCTTLSKYHTECDNCFNHLFYQTNSGSWIVRTSRIFIPSLFSWSAKKTDGFFECLCVYQKFFFPLYCSDWIQCHFPKIDWNCSFDCENKIHVGFMHFLYLTLNSE